MMQAGDTTVNYGIISTNGSPIIFTNGKGMMQAGDTTVNYGIISTNGRIIKRQKVMQQQAPKKLLVKATPQPDSSSQDLESHSMEDAEKAVDAISHVKATIVSQDKSMSSSVESQEPCSGEEAAAAPKFKASSDEKRTSLSVASIHGVSKDAKI